MAAGFHQVRGDRKRIGQNVETGRRQEFNHSKRRRSAADDDAVAGFDKLRRSARDSALLRNIESLTEVERNSDQACFMTWADSFGTPTDTAQLALFGHCIDVPATGGLGWAQQLDQLDEADDDALVDEVD